MHLLAQGLAQRVVQNMGRRMVQHRGITAVAVDAQADAPSLLKRAHIAVQNSANVKDRAIVLAGIGDFEQAAGRGLDHTAVADLAAALRIKGSLRRNDREVAIISMSSDNFRFRLVSVVKKAR